MKVIFFLYLFFCVLVAVINGKHGKSKSDFEADYGEMADETLPTHNVNYFDPTVENVQSNDNIPVEVRTKPQVFVANIGDIVRLPCEVTNDDFVLIWRKNYTLLYQSETPLHRNSNIKRDSSGALLVNLTSENDFGEYSCEIMTNEHLKIIHTIVRLAAPTILTISTALNKETYKVGETLTLTCNATGYPKPKISWHKDNKRLEREGEVLIIEDLTFRDAGSYRCLADNKIEPPAHDNITIHVEHKPVVSIEKYIVNSDKEFDAELKCTVHAFPRANIVWKKNGTNVKSIPAKIKLEQLQNNIENRLIITNLTDEDFDQYTCSAKNSIGKVDKTINLVRTPAVQGLNKPEKINKDFVLTWRVESKSPIEEHELQYRKNGEEEWKIIKPEVTKTNQDTYIVKHTLKGLDAGNYEIRVRSRNSHGWSQYSDIITFDGILAKNGSHHKPHNKKHHKEKNLKEKQVPTSAPETPAQPPEPERSESSVKEKQPTPITAAVPARQEYSHSNSSTKVRSSGYSLVPSTVRIISIALLSLFFYSQ